MTQWTMDFFLEILSPPKPNVRYVFASFVTAWKIVSTVWSLYYLTHYERLQYPLDGRYIHPHDWNENGLPILWLTYCSHRNTTWHSFIEPAQSVCFLKKLVTHYLLFWGCYHWNLEFLRHEIQIFTCEWFPAKELFITCCHTQTCEAWPQCLDFYHGNNDGAFKKKFLLILLDDNKLKSTLWSLSY